MRVIVAAYLTTKLKSKKRSVVITTSFVPISLQQNNETLMNLKGTPWTLRKTKT